MHKENSRRFFALLLAMAIVMSMAGTAHAVTYDLTAGTTTVTMPDSAIIQMAGFGLNGGPITVPGPVLEASEGDTLTINLTNNLAFPVTIVIPGQRIEMPAPVMEGGRVRSFVPESGTFTFTGLRAGTYLYESGTNPSVQVPLGLYGVLIVRPATAGQAYNDEVSAFDTEKVVVFSDVDPTLNQAVAGGTYGTAAYPSTVNYRAQYFLIKGKAYPDTRPFAANNGDRVLLRFANAGLETYMPTINGLRMLVIAEDGFLLPFPLSVTSLILPAGKTQDVIVTPANDSKYAFFDRRLNLSNAGATGVGGMLTHIVTGDAALQFERSMTVPPIAAEDGWIIESNEDSNVGGAFRAGNSGPQSLRIGDDFGIYVGERQYKTIVSFNTSVLGADATVLGAQLRLVQGGLLGTNPFTTHGSCFVDIVTGSFGTADLSASDFQAPATATQVATMSNPVGNGGISTGTLNGAGIAAINTTGITQMRIYFSLDDNDDNADDLIGFRSANDLNSARWPVLEISYLDLW